MRVLIVRLGSLGDLVHALPAVAAIRRAHPDADIDWLVDAVHRPFLDLVPVVSSIVELTSRTARGWFDVRRRLRRRRYDVALDFQGLIKSAALARLSGARRVLGFDRAALRERAAAAFYTERIAVGEGRHVVQKNLHLAAAIGAATDVVTCPLRPVESEALRTVLERGLGRFALINPGAAWPNKRWPPDRFGRTAAWLREAHALSSVVLWGPDERDLAQAVAGASAGAAVVAPPTRLQDLVAFSRSADLIVSGDTGPTHIAAAVGTPVVALFGPTDPLRNGPWADDDVSVSRYAECDCHYQRRCRRAPDRWCLGTITEPSVREAITLRLSRRGRGGLEP